MRGLLIASLASLILAGCTPTQAPVPQAGGQSFPRELSAGDRATCLSSGGRVERRGRLQAELCVRPFADAGKACTDKADCEGRCIAVGNADVPPVGGQCQADDRLFGCFAEVRGGKAANTLCVD